MPVFIKIQKLRMLLREKSFEAWHKQKSNFDKNIFESEIEEVKNKLMLYTKFVHLFRINRYFLKIIKIFRSY